MKVKCVLCQCVVEHDPRHIQGCCCDPDAATWVYIERDGTVKGFSNSKWEQVDEEMESGEKSTGEMESSR